MVNGEREREREREGPDRTTLASNYVELHTRLRAIASHEIFEFKYRIKPLSFFIDNARGVNGPSSQ